MSDDDDWFERALRDDAGEATTDPEVDGRDAEFGDAGNEDPGESDGSDDPGGDEAPAGGFADADPYDADDRRASDGRASADDGRRSSGGPTPSADAPASSRREPPSPDSDEGDLFEEDFASAFENAPGGAEPAGGTDSAESGSAGESGPVDGPSAGDDPAGAFGGGGEFGMDDETGFGGGFGGSTETFDDEEFESSIPRIDLGIEGLDDMIQGGVPERSLITTIGSAGTGKTTFGLQFLHEALEAGENAVFITLEESHERIVDTATEKGWNFDEYVADGSLAVIDLDPIEMANSLTSIRNDLPRLVEEFGATRLVLDSVSLLEMMYDDQATRRNEIYDFTKSLKEAGVTTMLTSEASEDTPYASRHGIIEYLVDGVFVLRYIRSGDDFRETRLAVEIQKIRDANHSREIKPYAITDEGISVYRQANIF